MDAIQWLESNARGFADLTVPERSAPMHFSLLWSYFEANALNTSGSARAIITWAQKLHSEGKLDAATFAQAIEYIKSRYFQGGEFTHHFHSLNLKSNDRPDLVRAVLSGVTEDPVDSVAALFIVIYRFRNNYFHGSKWSYSMREQFDNFTVANNSLMDAMNAYLPDIGDALPRYDPPQANVLS